MFAEAVAALSTVKQAQEILSVFNKNDAEYDMAQLKLKMTEVIDLLNNAKLQLYQQIDLNREMEEENRQLKELLAKKSAMTYETPFYFAMKQDKKDGPFCATCWDDKSKQIRLMHGENDTWECNICNNRFYGPNRRQYRHSAIPSDY